MKIRE